MILSDRQQKEWIPGCPIRIGRIKLEQIGESDTVTAEITVEVCGGFRIDNYTIDIEYSDSRRSLIGADRGVVQKPDENGVSERIPVRFDNAVYAFAIVRSAAYSMPSGEALSWTNDSDNRGIVLPDQEILWQTDPNYEAIHVECSGTTEPKYVYESLPEYGAWRCVCGHLNLDSSDKCGGCGCTRSWIGEHLSAENLSRVKTEIAGRNERDTERIIKKKQHEVTDRTKMILILAAFAAAALLIVLTFTTFIPLSKYSSAAKLVDRGEFDRAIQIYNELDGFRDSKNKASEAAYKKAQSITGLESVNMVYSASAPWFSITKDGVLSFKKDKYSGEWESFTVPDVVDGIVVRELDRNFFMNCDELVTAVISDCVEVIGEQCFYNCAMLENVQFGKSVQKIMPRAFINCTSLTELEIPDTVTYLGLRAFNNCVNLRKVVLGEGIGELSSYLFSMCFSLERITLKTPIKSVGEFAFSECGELQKIHCRFDEDEWIEPEVGEGNEAFTAAERYFNQ